MPVAIWGSFLASISLVPPPPHPAVSQPQIGEIPNQMPFQLCSNFRCWFFLIIVKYTMLRGFLPLNSINGILASAAVPGPRREAGPGDGAGGGCW